MSAAARDAVFVTGAFGFVGRHLLPHLSARFGRVFALRRPGSRDVAASPGVATIEADLRDTEGYEHALGECATVVHLAAATGKRRAAEYFDVNTAGTTRLLQACRRAGVRRFVFMSTIAATFADRRHYPYAESKARAEDAVRASGLEHVIVRPTVVLGPGAPAWAGLGALVRGGLLVVPGEGRTVMQPIDVEDLVAVVGELVERFPASATIELGGPERVTVEGLLRAIARQRRPGDPWVVHLPLGPVVAGLAAVEPLLLPLLPVTAGQLSAFRHDTTARAPGVGPAPVKGVEAMLAESGLVPVDGARSVLARECRALARHLTGHEPPSYVVDKYADAHARLVGLREASGFDRLLVCLAVRHPCLARLVDAYTGVGARRALVRRKWVLLLALLETTGSTAGRFDRPDPRSPLSLAVSAIAAAAAYAATLALSLVTMLPLHIVSAAGARLLARGSR